MALRVSAEVEAELDTIWSYVATESGDTEVADRLVNSITDTSLCFPNIRNWVDRAIMICAPICEVYRLANSSPYREAGRDHSPRISWTSKPQETALTVDSFAA